jgi:transposase InsO family protein
MEIRSITKKKYKATTHSKHSLPVFENLLQRNFHSEKPNEKWVTDITYISTDEGWLYLASVMDLYSRQIIGWHTDKRMTKKLVITALDQAYRAQKPEEGVLHHSDRGSQYASYAYRKRLETYKMVGSMSRKGDCYDNAVIESFHSIIKRERIYRNRYRTRKQARQDIFWYMEVFYNRKRPHSTIDYCSPMEYENMYDKDLGVAA